MMVVQQHVSNKMNWNKMKHQFPNHLVSTFRNRKKYVFRCIETQYYYKLSMYLNESHPCLAQACPVALDLPWSNPDCIECQFAIKIIWNFINCSDTKNIVPVILRNKKVFKDS